KEKRLALEKLANTQSTEIQVFSTYLDKNIEKAFSSIQKRLGSSLQIKRLHFFETKNKPEKHIENKLFKGNSTISNKNVVITDKVFLFEKNAIHIIKQKNTVKFFELMFDSFWKNL
ncbi:MAG: hypothetical protein KAQ63_02405, partial [Candidatus Moranbacteria bacterium]|nr:hypothetical protein [Candidatus Moranbacteria bacterium]